MYCPLLPKRKIAGLLHWWVWLEVFISISLLFILLFPRYASESLFFIIWIWTFTVVVTYFKGFKVLSNLITVGINTDSELLRTQCSKNRNYLLFVLFFDLIPFLVFPRVIFRYLFWRSRNSMQKY